MTWLRRSFMWAVRSPTRERRGRGGGPPRKGLAPALRRGRGGGGLVFGLAPGRLERGGRGGGPRHGSGDEPPARRNAGRGVVVVRHVAAPSGPGLHLAGTSRDDLNQ